MPKMIVFLCGARDFHAMDWYRSAKELVHDNEVIIVTDLIESEGFNKLLKDGDVVYKLLIIDKLLCRKQSAFGNTWRNLIKLLVFPIQVILLRNFSRKNPNAIYHAHSMYYLFLGWIAGIDYVGTPQGSDILIKPNKSKLYRYFSIKSLNAAKAITVDSFQMKSKINELANVDAHIIQNGIDIREISSFLNDKNTTSCTIKGIPSIKGFLSIRGLTPLYRIEDIITARNLSLQYSEIPITLIYPFKDSEYAKSIESLIRPFDRNFGRLERSEMYILLNDLKLVFSIPYSDSSPRSVYEAIFCGCAVAITHHPYYDYLPNCMKSRIVIVELSDKGWFDKALGSLLEIIKVPYIPSEEALDLFDQRRSFKKVEKLLLSQ